MLITNERLAELGITPEQHDAALTIEGDDDGFKYNLYLEHRDSGFDHVASMKYAITGYSN